MNRVYLKWTSISVIVCLVGLILSGAACDRDTNMVEKLIRKRADIMENTLSGKITFKEGKKQLREIEEGKLYSEDIKGMMAYMNSDYDKITDIDIIRLEKVNDVYDTVAFDSEIKWTYQSMEETYSENNKYYIGAKEEKNKLKLVSFELIE